MRPSEKGPVDMAPAPLCFAMDSDDQSGFDVVDSGLHWFELKGRNSKLKQTLFKDAKPRKEPSKNDQKSLYRARRGRDAH